MPMVTVSTNVPAAELPDDFELKLTEIIANSLGKPMNRILIETHAGKRMLHGAVPGPVVHLTLKSIGCLGPTSNIQHTQRLTEYLGQTLKVAKDKTVIEFYDLSPYQVGFNGTTVEDANSKN